jgi:putative ABC transport system permease protein
MLWRFSSVWESFRVAVASLRANKLRTMLTLVGIVVGVSAVIAVVTIIKGLDKTVASTFSSQGSTVFTIAKRPLIINILSQFLIETVALTAIGGLAGLAVGEVASLIMNKYSPLPAYVPLWAIAVGIGISAAIGIIFGLWPAWKAARLDPIEALRYE